MLRWYLHHRVMWGDQVHPTQVRLAQMEIDSLCRAVSEQLPHTGGNICVLGGCATRRNPAESVDVFFMGKSAN